MKRTIAFCISVGVSLLRLYGASIHSVAKIADFLDGKPAPQITFVVTATVTRVESKIIYVTDGLGHVDIYNRHSDLKAGDVADLRGVATFHLDGNASAQITNEAVVIKKTEPPRPAERDLSALDSHAWNRSLISICGTVQDIIRDEIDPNFAFVVLKHGNATLPVAIDAKETTAAATLQDAVVRAEGVFRRRVSGYRYFFGPFLIATKPLVAIAPPPQNPFDHPRLSFYPMPTADELYAMTKRTLAGTVLATWRPSSILLKSDENKIVRIDIVEGHDMPHIGDHIEAVGYPTTDLFHINLTKAAYRLTGKSGRDAFGEPIAIEYDRIFTKDGTPSEYAIFNLQGKLGTVTGEIKERYDVLSAPGRYTLHCRGCNLTIDVSGLRDKILPVNSTAKITGVFMLENENWSPDNTFPQVKGVVLLPRHSSDIVIVSNPPWFTSKHFFAIIATLLVGLFAILLWNHYLNRLVNRRGLELAREKLKKESAQLKTNERTRLAVELHDSLSQNLEGVACQIAATQSLMVQNTNAAKTSIGTAQRMLDSCRFELKRCLFDLRGKALEEKDLADAIRTTLAPLCDGIELDIDFNIRRTHFDDTTVHATLCMIRELVSNAIRHGQATKIRVAGEYRGGMLSFSVCDNGCGFDPDNCAGPSQGHFGLAGVRERAERLDGTVEVLSEPGKGTTANVKLKVKS